MSHGAAEAVAIRHLELHRVCPRGGEGVRGSLLGRGVRGPRERVAEVPLARPERRVAAPARRAVLELQRRGGPWPPAGTRLGPSPGGAGGAGVARPVPPPESVLGLPAVKP